MEDQVDVDVDMFQFPSPQIRMYPMINSILYSVLEYRSSYNYEYNRWSYFITHISPSATPKH